MAFVVVYDACVLYPGTVRDLLIRIHQAGLVQAKWTEEILDETFAALRRNLPDVTEERHERLRTLMVKAVTDCFVTNYQPLIEGLTLPDPDDRHVLAAAIRARAQVIVTNNCRDFPRECVASWDIDVKTADEFVLDQISLNQRAVYGEIVRIADSHKNPPEAVADVLDRLERSGLVESVAALAD